MPENTPLKEHPILFSGEMVRAILEDRKTQTRRPIKLAVQLDNTYSRRKIKYTPGTTTITGKKGDWTYYGKTEDGVIEPFVLRLPWKPGDLLWVRETAWYDDSFGGRAFFENGDVIVKGAGIVSKAPHPCSREMFEAWGLQKCRPSIHMPRWASRITLKVKDVRVERVQEISERDAYNEGMPECGHDAYHTDQCTCSFSKLWDSIYSKRGLGWKENPWVWVTEFERKDN